MFRSSDVWSPQSWWVDSNLECYCSSQSSYFRSYSSFRRGSFDVADHRDHEIIAKLILQPFQQLEIFLRNNLAAQADWVRDLSITWCQSRHKQYFLLAGNSEYTPNAPTKPWVEKSLKNPLVSQVKYRAFSGKWYWGINACSTVFGFAFTGGAGDWNSAGPFGLCSHTAKLLATDPFGGGGNGGWATETILDGPELDAASITCLGTGDGSFRAAVILTLCSVSTTCRDALANFGTEPLGVFAFAITTPGDDDEAAASTERPGTSHLTVALELLKRLSSRMYRYSLENAPLCNPCSRTAAFWDFSPTTRPMPVDCPPENVPYRSYLCSRQEPGLTAAKGSKTRHAELDENVDLKPYSW